MKKIISTLLAVVCVLSVFTACGSNNSGAESGAESSVSTDGDNGDYVIRNVKWGMSVDDVKSAETAELESEEEDKNLRYKNIDMFGQKFELIYSFSYAKGLKSAVYASPNVLEDEAKELEKSIVDTLTEKYGKAEVGGGLYDLVWHSGDTQISFIKGTPEESVNLTFFRIWYEKDDSAAQKSDNGNL